MPDEEVGVDMVDFVRKRDLMTFAIHPDYAGFKRKYIPGEVPGKEYPEETEVMVYNYHDQYILRIFPSTSTTRMQFVNLRQLKARIDLKELRKIYPGKWDRICMDPVKKV
jgi:hypothetical protein